MPDNAGEGYAQDDQAGEEPSAAVDVSAPGDVAVATEQDGAQNYSAGDKRARDDDVVSGNTSESAAKRPAAGASDMVQPAQMLLAAAMQGIPSRQAHDAQHQQPGAPVDPAMAAWQANTMSPQQYLHALMMQQQQQQQQQVATKAATGDASVASVPLPDASAEHFASFMHHHLLQQQQHHTAPHFDFGSAVAAAAAYGAHTRPGGGTPSFTPLPASGSALEDAHADGQHGDASAPETGGEGVPGEGTGEQERGKGGAFEGLLWLWTTLKNVEERLNREKQQMEDGLHMLVQEHVSDRRNLRKHDEFYKDAEEAVKVSTKIIADLKQSWSPHTGEGARLAAVFANNPTLAAGAGALAHGLQQVGADGHYAPGAPEGWQSAPEPQVSLPEDIPST